MFADRLVGFVELAGLNNRNSRWDWFFRVLLAGSGLAALGLIVAITGWKHDVEFLPWLEGIGRGVLATYSVCQVGRLIAAPSRISWLKRRWPSLVLAVGGAVMALWFRSTLTTLGEIFPRIPAAQLAFLLIASSQVPVLADLGLRFLRFQEIFAERRVSPGAVMIVTFGALIVVGTLLLKMPSATVHGISWLDALFTSTSAVCVTGLNVVDVELTFTPTGQTILLLLIQVGGLGVMTLTTFLAAIFGSISLRGRVLLQDLLSEENLGRIGRTLPLLLAMTFVVEAAGAFALHAALDGLPDARARGWFPAVFHSVSAFCNAGFSIWSGGLYDPVVRGNESVQAVIMALIIIGGLGFPVVFATSTWLGGSLTRLVRRRQRRAVLSLHARIAWTTTIILIVGGMLGLMLTEHGRDSAAGGNAPAMLALFNSVTARTAGFNIGPIEALSPASVLLLIFLMFVGGSPGSTAGGVKTTVFAVVVLNARRIVLGRPDVEAFRRRLSEDTVARSVAVVSVAVIWILVASVLLSVLHPGRHLSDLVFEVVSAVSTVGLSRGITPQLDAAGKLLIVLTMFAGRIGVLFFVLAFTRRRDPAPLRLPEENVLVA